jgi:TARSH-like protein
MTNLSILKKFAPFFLCAAPLSALLVGCGASDAVTGDQNGNAQPIVPELSAPGATEGESGGRASQAVVPGTAGRDPGGRPRDGGACEFGGFSWQAQSFALYPDEQACLGDQWVRYDEGIRLWVGLTTCSSDETRIYLSASPEGPFLAATDYAGHGQDHCELVNAAFTLTDEDDITSGGCADCSTGVNLPLEGVSVYGRGYLGEAFEFVESTPEWSYQVSKLRCGVELGCQASPPPPPPPPPADGGPIVINDCAYGGGSYVAPGKPGEAELLVVGVYETRSDHGFDYHPTGEAKVRDTRSTPHVLVLSSYEPTNWTIEADAASGLYEVILNGYHAQTASVPEGVKVSDRSGVENYFAACGYEWPSDDQGCDTPGLVAGAEDFSRLTLSAFSGCYRATDFDVRDDASIVQK